MSPITELLAKLTKSEASDLHIASGAPPSYRLHGEIVPIAAAEAPATPDEVEKAIFSLLTEDQRGHLLEHGEIDFSARLADLGRFRCNVHRQRGTWAGVFRKIPVDIPTFEELGLPEVVRSLTKKEGGLIVVTGPSGSGKSTTMAAMLEEINATRRCHIITVEDPIEFVFKNKKAIVKQREIGSDTKDYATALQHIARQDPDVVMVGEIRDQATISTALSVAATGRLVLGTLTTMDAASTVNGLIESFPPAQQTVVQNQISGCLEGIISQQLVQKADGHGRALACEILISTPSIRNMIRTGKSMQVQNDMEIGKRFGMQTINQALQELIVKGTVKLEQTLRHTRTPDALIKNVGVPK
jgi:twitching motility protein PilT